MTDVPDTIEREIDIAATPDAVWELVATPGWYINSGTIVDDHRIEYHDDGIAVVHDPTNGTFTMRTVALERPRYAAFRWLTRPDGDPAVDGLTGDEVPSTLVEFWVDALPAGGSRLRVVESGFASLPGDAIARRAAREGNVEGWETELAAARTLLEGRHPDRVDDVVGEAR